MNPKEKFDSIIMKIEDEVNNTEYVRDLELAEKIEAGTGITLRDLATVFIFLMDKSLAAYIKSRRMNRAYISIIEKDEFDCNEAIDITGYGDQPAFSKAFKKIYEMSPREAYKAYKENNTDLRTDPVVWDSLLSQQQCASCGIYPEDNPGFPVFAYKVKDYKKYKEKYKENEIFGIDMERYDRIIKADTYRKMFGFGVNQSNTAFQLAEFCGKPLKAAFEFVDEFTIRWDMDDEGEFVENNILKPGMVPALAPEFKACCETGLSIQEYEELVEELEEAGIDSSLMTSEDLKYCSGSNIPLDQFWENYTFAKEHIDETDGCSMDEFLIAIELWGKEDAIADVTGDYEFSMPCEGECMEGFLDSYFSIHEEREEEEMYGSDEQIDDDLYYDPDNPEYNEYKEQEEFVEEEFNLKLRR